MKLPEQIKVLTTVEGKPVPGLLLELSIVTTFKNNFHLLFGPTDNAELVITRADMIREALREQEMFPMDFGDPEIHFAGDLVVSIFGREKLERAMDAYRIFKDSVEFPADYVNRLQRAQETLENLGGKEILLRLAINDSGNVVIRSETDY